MLRKLQKEKAKARKSAKKKKSDIIEERRTAPDKISLEINKFETVDFGCGDLDGDGTDEIIVTNGKIIRVYGFEPTNERYHLITTYKMGFKDTIVDLSVGDIDSDGRSEIAAISYPGRYVKSYVFNLVDKEIKPREDFYNKFVKIMKINKNYSMMLIQSFSNTMIFTGPVKEVLYSQGKLRDDIGRMWKKVDIFGFNMADIDSDRSNDILYINTDGYLERIRNENRIWQGVTQYGGSRIKFTSKRNDKEVMKNSSLLTYMDSNSSYVFVVKNQRARGKFFNLFSLNISNPYKSGVIHSLKWDKNVFTEDWATRTIEGYIPGIDVMYLDKASPFILVAASVTGTGRKAHTIFHFIEIPDKQ